jgi:hypothetical protein
LPDRSLSKTAPRQALAGELSRALRPSRRGRRARRGSSGKTVPGEQTRRGCGGTSSRRSARAFSWCRIASADDADLPRPLHAQTCGTRAAPKRFASRRRVHARASELRAADRARATIRGPFVQPPPMAAQTAPDPFRHLGPPPSIDAAEGSETGKVRIFSGNEGAKSVRIRCSLEARRSNCVLERRPEFKRGRVSGWLREVLAVQARCCPLSICETAIRPEWPAAIFADRRPCLTGAFL